MSPVGSEVITFSHATTSVVLSGVLSTLERFTMAVGTVCVLCAGACVVYMYMYVCMCVVGVSICIVSILNF